MRQRRDEEEERKRNLTWLCEQLFNPIYRMRRRRRRRRCRRRCKRRCKRRYHSSNLSWRWSYYLPLSCSLLFAPRRRRRRKRNDTSQHDRNGEGRREKRRSTNWNRDWWVSTKMVSFKVAVWLTKWKNMRTRGAVIHRPFREERGWQTRSARASELPARNALCFNDLFFQELKMISIGSRRRRASLIVASSCSATYFIFLW